MTHNGLLVAPTTTERGSLLYAEVVPAGSRWLPWVGRTSRWWFEVHVLDAPGTVQFHEPPYVDRSTLAYHERGSGGGFTLARCIRRATDAVQHFTEGYDDV